MRISYENPNRVRTLAAPWIRRLLLAWLCAVTLEYLLLPGPARALSGLDGVAQMSAGRMALVAGVVLALQWAVSAFLPAEAARWTLFTMAAVLAVLSLTASFSWAFLAAWVLVLAVLAVYGCCGWENRPVKMMAAAPVRERRGWAWITAVGALAFFLLVSAWTVGRVYSFSTPTFDFTIFAQMFHSMKTTGLPITTVERDGALSHFAVHVSPIYYLLLPFYCLVPTPATLQVLQAAVLASAVIPLWKLGKRHGLPVMLRGMLCLLLLLYPAYAGGTSYDIHENAFLTPLLLWLFYGMDRKNGMLTAAAAILTLMVKEDAAVYVAVAALYLLLRTLLRRDGRWGLITGGVMLAGALLWFAAVTGYLASSGDGVMTYRYRNFMFDGSSSLLTVVKAVLRSPMKAIFECVDSEKLEFIGLTLLTLAGLPLLTRRYERYVLLIPYILVNLMSDYQYQHDIFFQYTYGATAFLIYLTLVNLADFRLEKRQAAALWAALCISAGCFCAWIMPVALKYPSYCVTYSGYYNSLREVLDTVPDGASVAATTFYTTYLSQRDKLYDVRYSSQEHVLECEYVVVGVTDSGSLKKYAVSGKKGYENFVKMLTENGYTQIAAHEGRLEVYRKAVTN